MLVLLCVQEEEKNTTFYYKQAKDMQTCQESKKNLINKIHKLVVKESSSM
jgi:hypothetical protein